MKEHSGIWIGQRALRLSGMMAWRRRLTKRALISTHSQRYLVDSPYTSWDCPRLQECFKPSIGRNQIKVVFVAPNDIEACLRVLGSHIIVNRPRPTDCDQASVRPRGQVKAELFFEVHACVTRAMRGNNLKAQNILPFLRPSVPKMVVPENNLL